MTRLPEMPPCTHGRPPTGNPRRACRSCLGAHIIDLQDTGYASKSGPLIPLLTKGTPTMANPTVFYDATHQAFNIMWPELTRVCGRNRIPEVHEFATTAAGRIGGTVEPARRPSGENYFGPTAAMLHEAAGNASAATGRSVDWFLRVYEAASQRVQQGEGS